MKMSKLEQAAKNQIIDILNKQGYPTYSKLLDKLDVKLIDTEKDPNSIAYLDTRTATIYLNPDLTIQQISTIVRHEILHEYLTHMVRSEKFKQSDPKYKNIPHELINIAADYEISNKGYTDEDKSIARGITIKDKILQGLVTEDEHPDWTNMTFEEMLKELADDQANTMQQLSQIMSDLGIEPPTPQEMEDIQNQAQSLQDQSSDEGNKEDAENIEQQASQIEQQIQQNNQSKSSNKGPFNTNQQQKIDEETAKKAEELKKALAELKNNIMDETESAIEKEIIAKRAKDAAKYKDTPLNRFTDSLNNFIKRKIAVGRGPSWQRINKKYYGTGLIKAGSSRLSQSHVPLINVYFDRSGSWDDPNKTKKGAQAIATLNKYVNRGELKINLYYFSNNVHSSEQAALNEGGTEGQPILDHIEATKPDNVIILTDDDIDDCRTNVTVPGGVWMLFYGGRSKNLMDHLHGRKLTKYFDIEV